MNSEQDKLYRIALKQAETSRRYGRQARQESSAEEAIEVMADYVRLADEHEQTKDSYFSLQALEMRLKTEIQSLHGKVGAATRAINALKKLNSQQERKIKKIISDRAKQQGVEIANDKIIENQNDTIVELTLQLDERDVQ